MVAALLILATLIASGEETPHDTSVPYEAVREHELKPHRRSIPLTGIDPGVHQLHLTLTISATGDVTEVSASGEADDLRFWPTIEGEVWQWRFTPFQSGGHAAARVVDEYVDLVPPERLPEHHVPPPNLTTHSDVTLFLERTGCLGSCPSYTVRLSTNGILFVGNSSVVATGKHLDSADASKVRALAKHFVDADFYSMADSYQAGATDLPTYILQVTIDGKSKKVVDYEGSWDGMPAIMTDLEEQVDTLAGTPRWIEGDEGLVPTLEAEHFNFHTSAAQQMAKAAASRGKTATVEEFLQAGVPLTQLPTPDRIRSRADRSFRPQGWLESASNHPDTLNVLLRAGASRNNQDDKDLALLGAARNGEVGVARTLIDYGANPKVNPATLTVTENGGGGFLQGPGSGSALIYAAESGSPAMIRELLPFHLDLEARDREGKTAIFAAGNYRSTDQDGARVECVRLLAKAGADVNARDNDGNTPLHETFLTDVIEEFIALGARVNARNNEGETPIFTTVDDAAIPLLMEHGADLTIQNNNGETVVEAAVRKGPLRQEALRLAISSTSK